MYLCARDLGYQWKPTLIDQQVVFAAELATIGRVLTRMLAARGGTHTDSVNASSIPHDLVVLTQPLEDCLADALSNASFYPFAEPPPTSHATATAEAFPRCTGLQHK